MAENSKPEGNKPGVGLTTRQGHPVYDNQNTRSVGPRGPLVLEDYQFLEKITHFDRERIPERVVHARGAGAHGWFIPTGRAGDLSMEEFSRAKVFRKGTRTPVFIRFSTVTHGAQSPETLRDPRGFAIKFYTETGNWDLVGNNLKVFFIRDPIKFPDLIHSFKPDPVINIQHPNRIFDFLSLTPESTHMVTWLFSPWGIPASYREMQGSGVNTYKLVNAHGQTVLCKFHFQPKLGVRNLRQEEANAIQATNWNHATQDLYEAIERGDHPEWDMFIQVMSDDDHPELEWDPLDATKLWPEDQFPMLHVGTVVLDRNPADFFNEVEQVAFGTGVLVDGIDFSDDKLLLGRTFSYSDTQRYRVGPNYLQLPINAPQCPFATNQRGGQMSYFVDGADQGTDPHVNYEPSNRRGLRQQDRLGPPPRIFVEGQVGRQPIERPCNFKQPGDRWRMFTDEERDELVSNLVNALSQCDRIVQERMVSNFTRSDQDYGRRVAEGLGISAPATATASP